MERILSEKEFKEILKLIKKVREDIKKARKSKINVTEKAENFMENGIEPTKEQAVQLDLLIDECNYEIELLKRGE